MSTWSREVIDVRGRLIPKVLWTTASIDVYLGDHCILATGGQLKLTGTVSKEFLHDGAHHTAKLHWGVFRLRSFPSKLFIDDVAIADSDVFLSNWPVGYLASIAIGAILYLLFRLIRG